MSADLFDEYENGVVRFLEDLEKKSGKHALAYQDAVSFQSQLHANIQTARNFRDTPELEHRRNEILYELNRLSMEELEKPFNEYYLRPKQRQADAHKETPSSKSTVFELPTTDERILRIAQTCQRRGLTREIIDRLVHILSDAICRSENENIATTIKGEEMSLDNPSEELFLQSSRILGRYLVQLEDYHSRWPHLTLADPITERSVAVLQEIQHQVLITEPFVEQVRKSEWGKIESVAMITALGKLKHTLRRIDEDLLKGDMSFNVSDDLEQHFSDITYHVARYLLLLDELGSQKSKDMILQ